LKKEISEKGAICLALIDSEDIPKDRAATIAKKAEECGVSGILVGGSTAVDQLELDAIVSAVKKAVTSPVILFPGNITGVSPSADAIFFSSLLNSENPYFITGAQALGALAVKKYGLEAIPMGYLIVGEGGATGFVGRARGIPQNKPNLAAMYALAAQYLGLRFLYLEAGSGVTSHVASQVVEAVRRSYQGVLIVGGGIRSVEEAVSISKSGADIIVVGTLLESEGFEEVLKKIVEGIRITKGRPVGA